MFENSISSLKDSYPIITFSQFLYEQVFVVLQYTSCAANDGAGAFR